MSDSLATPATAYQVIAPDPWSFCAALVIAQDGQVIGAAPILYKRFFGRHITYVNRECHRFGWSIEIVPDSPLTRLVNDLTAEGLQG